VDGDTSQARVGNLLICLILSVVLALAQWLSDDAFGALGDFFMRIACVALLCAAAVAGCAKDADQVGATYTSPVLYENFSCPQLAEEAQRVSSHAAQAAGVQDQKATNDKVAMGVGLIVFWPVMLMTKGNDENTAELARLKGQMNAIEEASIKKRCGITFQHAPPPSAPVAENGSAVH